MTVIDYFNSSTIQFSSALTDLQVQHKSSPDYYYYKSDIIRHDNLCCRS